MIPANRPVVAVEDIAQLHGLTMRQARRRKPWAANGHPQPLTARGGGARPPLWDRAQADAFARGEPIPPLPTSPSPNDLLDRIEAAELAGIDPVAWRRYLYRGGYVPADDVTIHGQPFWFRSTIETFNKTRRQGPQWGGGRPTGYSPPHWGEIRSRVEQLLERQPDLAIAAVARELGIAYTTAHGHVHAIRGARTTVEQARKLTRTVTSERKAEEWLNQLQREHQLVRTTMDKTARGWKVTAYVTDLQSGSADESPRQQMSMAFVAADGSHRRLSWPQASALRAIEAADGRPVRNGETTITRRTAESLGKSGLVQLESAGPDNWVISKLTPLGAEVLAEARKVLLGEI